MGIRLGVLASLAAAFLFVGTGCSNNKIAAERDSALSQNKDLKQQLDAEIAARQAAESKAAAMNSQLTAAPPVAQAPVTPSMAGSLELLGAPPAGRTTGRTGTTPVRTATPKPIVTKVTIPGEVLFDSGKTTLTAAASKTLDAIAATIKKEHSGEKIVVEGYTDATPVKAGSKLVSNEALAASRAAAVKTYLSKKGIPAADITVKSLGTTDPASTKNPALNRRVEVAVMVEK